MSFDKYYPKRKDWRKQYKGSKRFDRSCRCHGGCGYCLDNRMHNLRREKEKAEYSEKELDF
jgi:hypothetical protein